MISYFALQFLQILFIILAINAFQIAMFFSVVSFALIHIIISLTKLNWLIEQVRKDTLNQINSLNCRGNFHRHLNFQIASLPQIFNYLFNHLRDFAIHGSHVQLKLLCCRFWFADAIALLGQPLMEIHIIVILRIYKQLYFRNKINYFWEFQLWVIEMQADNEPIVSGVINDVMELVWKGVAHEIIRKKLALKASNLEVFQFMASYLSNATQNREDNTVVMLCEKDPSPITIDNLAYGEIQKQKRQNSPSPPRKTSINESINQTRSRRFTLESFNKDKSVADSKGNASFEQKDNGLITLPEVQDIHYVQDPQEDTCRNGVFRSQKEQVQMKKLLADRQKEREESSVRNKKLLKDLKKYTYDFQGNFVVAGAGESQHQKIVKMDKTNGEQAVIKKEQKAPEQKSINNDKIKERETRDNRQSSKLDKNQPEFNQNRPESLLDMFEEDNKISEGIKLIGQKGNQKIIKQKPRRKLSGMKKYRLNQYQNIIKDQKFKDYKKTSSKYTSTTIDVNKTAPLGSYNPQISKNNEPLQSKRPNLTSNSELSLTLKKEEPSALLPPIQSTFLKKSNKIGMRRLSIGYQESSRSLNQSGIQSRKSRKSQIKIDHEELYLQNFTLSAYGYKK